MNWEANLIELIQKYSSSFSDVMMLFLTVLGSEIIFLVVIVSLYWCYNKRLAYKFFNVYIFSVAATTFLKMVVGRVRPYQRYSDRIISIGEETGGGSFPSGHSQSIANISTQSFINTKMHKTGALIFGIVLTVIVMFSRIYLGQHYLTDVIVGAACGIIFAVICSMLFELLGNREELIMLGLLPLSIIGAIVMVIIGGISADANVMKVLGAIAAFTGGYYIEKKFVKHEPKTAKVSKTILKLIIGLGVGIGLKEGLKYIFPSHITILHEFLRYFILAAWCSLGACALFKALKL